jgi:hypothetical protein
LEIGIGDQWGALAALGAVCGSEIGDDEALGLFCKKGRVEELESQGGFVEERLAMGGDGGDIDCLKVCNINELNDSSGIAKGDVSAELEILLYI